jgi:uncharacterized protein (DUF983 family)
MERGTERSRKTGGFTMKQFWIILWRGLLLRCPRCGQGKLFRRWFKMYERCPVCHLLYEREPGFYTGGMAINLVISELIVAAFVIPFSVWAALNANVPFIPILIAISPLPVLLPILFFRHSRSFWIGLNYWLDPPKQTADEYQWDPNTRQHR